MQLRSVEREARDVTSQHDRHDVIIVGVLDEDACRNGGTTDATATTCGGEDGL